MVARVRAAADEYRARLPAKIAAASPPHVLLPDNRGQALVRPPGLKTELLSVFSPLGFSANPRDDPAGIYRLRKTSTTGTRLEVALDIGSLEQPSLSVLFFVHVGWTYEMFRVPVSSATVHMLQYPIRSTSEWRLMVENLATIITYLETNLVPHLEAAAAGEETGVNSTEESDQ
ncbi:MAG: hypothetical protein OEM62_10670 [Acidobacteriota bacterium]|nr:hypothetical protein [Acidobacteriota bacterium]